YLKIVVNPFDNEAVLRIINVPRRGIGDKTINVLYQTAIENNTTLFDTIFSYEDLPLTGSAKNRIAEFKALLYNIVIKSNELSFVDFVKYVINESGIMMQYQEDTEENLDKRLNINELINSCEEYAKLNKDAKLQDYLSNVTLSSDTDDLSSGDFVTVATIHSVKGLEFDTVFIVGVDETILPISRACDSVEELEEERRLLYVAITRAKNQLYVTRARSRYLYGNRSLTEESRFLKGIKTIFKDESPYSSYSYNPYQKSTFKKPTYSESGYYPDVEDNYTSIGKVKSFASTIKTTQKPAPVKTNGKYVRGMKVSHPKFGEGVVINIKQTGSGDVLDVAFKNVGIKTLSSQFAPLTIIK
ncbi:MAG: ATP-binding domain-containing protein, partial [Clostridia bacterium]|nr:ATP-binding domain-containing protein [Clostridia bacterium]